MNLMQMSLSGAVMIVVIVVIRALSVNKFPKKTFLALWGAAAVRLLIPYSFRSVFSIYSLLVPFPAGASENVFIVKEICAKGVLIFFCKKLT